MHKKRFKLPINCKIKKKIKAEEFRSHKTTAISITKSQVLNSNSFMFLLSTEEHNWQKTIRQSSRNNSHSENLSFCVN